MSQNGAAASKGTNEGGCGRKGKRTSRRGQRGRVRKGWPRGTLHETEAKTHGDHLRCESAKVTRPELFGRMG